MNVLAAFWLAVLAAGSKPDTQWKLISRTRDIAMWIDAARVDSNRTDGMIGVWVRFVYAKPEPVPGDDKLMFSETRVEMAIDCHAELVRNLSMQLFGPDGRSVSSATHDFPATPVSFATHPFGHGTFIGICGWLRAPDRWRPVVVDTSIFSH